MKSRFLNFALDKVETIEFEGFNPDLSMLLWIKLEQLHFKVDQRESVYKVTLEGCNDMSRGMLLPLLILIVISLFVRIGDACHTCIGPCTGLNQNRNLFRERCKIKVTRQGL